MSSVPAQRDWQARGHARRELLALPQLFGREELGANKSAAPPRGVTYTDYGSITVEGDAKDLRNGKRTHYFDADAAGGNVYDQAIEPWLEWLGNDEAPPLVPDTLVAAPAEVFTVSHCCSPTSENMAKTSCAAVRRGS